MKLSIPSRKGKTIQEKSKAWRLVALFVVVVGALTVPGTVIYLQNRLANQHTQAQPWDDPQIAAKLDALRLAKAKMIREDVRDWAFQNKEQLRAMLASKGSDPQALKTVFKACPFTDSKVMTKPDTKSGAVKFGWLLDPQKTLDSGQNMNTSDRRFLEGEVPKAELQLVQQFKEQSDFPIAVSASAGPVETMLWASGRITEKRWVANPNRTKGQKTVITLPDKELVPPYDFLTSTQGS